MIGNPNEAYDLAFPNLKIYINHLVSSVTIPGINFRVAFYGLVIGTGMLIALLIAMKDGKRRGHKEDDYIDLLTLGIILGVIGARIYYVAFSWDYYKDNLLEIFNIRGGGLAIYGTVIGAFTALYIVSKKKGYGFFNMGDSAILGLIFGQIMGRWGNFFNMEAFGGYTDSLLAMRLRLDMVNSSMVSAEHLANLITDNGIEYIQVQPTFLYESLWNLIIFHIMLLYRRHKKFNGEIMCIYLAGYGLGRLWIEGLRTDSLYLGHTGIRVSQLVAGICIAAAAVLYAVLYKKNKACANAGVEQDAHPEAAEPEDGRIE